MKPTQHHLKFMFFYNEKQKNENFNLPTISENHFSAEFIRYISSRRSSPIFDSAIKINLICVLQIIHRIIKNHLQYRFLVTFYFHYSIFSFLLLFLLSTNYAAFTCRLLLISTDYPRNKCNPQSKENKIQKSKMYEKKLRINQI